MKYAVPALIIGFVIGFFLGEAVGIDYMENKQLEKDLRNLFRDLDLGETQ